MADINQVITLGIGTPAGIPEFLTLGLQIQNIPFDLWTDTLDIAQTWTDTLDIAQLVEKTLEF